VLGSPFSVLPERQRLAFRVLGQELPYAALNPLIGFFLERAVGAFEVEPSDAVNHFVGRDTKSCPALFPSRKNAVVNLDKAHTPMLPCTVTWSPAISTLGDIRRSPLFSIREVAPALFLRYLTSSLAKKMVSHSLLCLELQRANFPGHAGIDWIAPSIKSHLSGLSKSFTALESMCHQANKS
jgi:hypothetical protein